MTQRWWSWGGIHTELVWQLHQFHCGEDRWLSHLHGLTHTPNAGSGVRRGHLQYHSFLSEQAWLWLWRFHAYLVCSGPVNRINSCIGPKLQSVADLKRRSHCGAEPRLVWVLQHLSFMLNWAVAPYYRKEEETQTESVLGDKGKINVSHENYVILLHSFIIYMILYRGGL